MGVSVLCPGLVSTNLGSSERNRPADLRELDAEEIRARAEREPGFSQRGPMQRLTPEWVAECVLEAIKVDRFYILTHEDPEGHIERRHAATSSKRRHPRDRPLDRLRRRRAQAGVGGLKGLLINYRERRIRHMHKVIDDYVEGPDR